MTGSDYAARMDGAHPALDRDALRATLAGFDERRKKIVGGVIAIMIENPSRVREREWIAEQFTQVALLACDFEDVGSAREGQERLQAYVRANIDPVLNACYRLFQVVGADLTERGHAALTREDAVAHALGYFVERPAG